MRNGTAPRGQVNPIDELVADLLTRTLDAERKYVASGWWDEITFCNLGIHCRLTVARFYDRRLGYLFWYLCRCAELGPNPSETHCLSLAEGTSTVDLDTLDRAWLVRLIGEIHNPADLDVFAGQVAQLADHRERSAKAHLSALAELCVDTDQYEVVVRSKSFGSFIPQRLPRKETGHGHGIAV